MKKIAIVVPTFNRRKEITNIIMELIGQKVSFEVEEYQFIIIVVIDGSTDGTKDALQMLSGSINLIEGDGNWWYTKSINEGIKSARKFNPDFYLLLNDDIHIESDFLNKLFNTYHQINSECLLGTASLSFEKPHRVTFSGVRNATKFPYRRTHYIPFMSLVNLTELNGYVPSQELPGRGMLIPKTVIDTVGLFDEKFPQYFSDLDFSRTAYKKGFPIYVSYEAVSFSHVEKTSDSTTYKGISHTQFIKNLFNPYGRKHLGQIARYVWRHYPKSGFLFYYFRWILILFYNHFKVNVLKVSHAN